MMRSATTRFGSAHVLALTAIGLSLCGGGYALGATAHQAKAPGQTAGYSVATDAQSTQRAGRDNLVTQLVVPTRGFYVVNAKVNLSKASGAGFADGAVSCYIGDVPHAADDMNAVTIKKGDTATLSLVSMGGKVSGTGTQAFDLVCNGGDSKYVVSDAHVTAVKLDTVHSE